MQQAPTIHQPVKPIVRFNNQVLKSNQCLNLLLGQKIDIKWSRQHASMDIAPSTTLQFSHQVSQNQENFAAVPFFHKAQCPMLENVLKKNHSDNVPPCVVVLIQHKQTRKILATQRHERMSFGNQWVLPGGHLQRGQNIFQGGLRQCIEQVGLKLQAVIPQKNPGVMVWESVNVDQKLLKIKRVAFVIFFRIECEEFDVMQQKSQVKKWQWRSFGAQEFPWGGGWAEGHLRYLQFIKDSKIA